MRTAVTWLSGACFGFAICVLVKGMLWLGLLLLLQSAMLPFVFANFRWHQYFSMVRALLFVAALLVGWVAIGGRAEASNQAWHAIRDFTTVPPSTVRFGVSESAYIERPAGSSVRDFYASDGPHVAALFAAMTNGVNNPFTWQAADFSHTFNENLFFTPVLTAPPLQGYSSFLTQPKIDLQGWRIDFIQINVSNFETEKRYSVTVYGTAPEPTSAALFVFGLCAMGHRYHRRKVKFNASH